MRPISTRLDDRLHQRILDFARGQLEGPSEALRRIAEEWWAMQEFPSIEFRDGVTGRRSALRRGPDVWEVVMVWGDYGPSKREAFYDHFGGHLPREALDEALAYYERFPDEVDQRLALQQRVAERLEAQSPR